MNLSSQHEVALHIVDRGRGPQLSSCRISVQDLLPFYREGASNEEIRRWLPSLDDDAITLLKTYIRDHYEEVTAAEAQIKMHHDRMRAEQPAWTHASENVPLEERRKIMRRKLAERNAGENGAHDKASRIPH